MIRKKIVQTGRWTIVTGVLAAGGAASGAGVDRYDGQSLQDLRMAAGPALDATFHW